MTFVIHMCNLVIIMFWMRRILEKKFWSDLSCCQDLGDELWVLLKSNFDWIVARTIEKFSFLPPGSCKWEGSDQRNGKRVSPIKNQQWWRWWNDDDNYNDGSVVDNVGQAWYSGRIPCQVMLILYLFTTQMKYSVNIQC